MGFHVKCVKNSSPKTETNVVMITKPFTTDALIMNENCDILAN